MILSDISGYWFQEMSVTLVDLFHYRRNQMVNSVSTWHSKDPKLTDKNENFVGPLLYCQK